MPTLRIAVLGSGAGSNFAAILQSIQAGALRAEVVLALSDNPGSPFVGLARRHHIPLRLLDCGPHPLRTTPASQQTLHDHLVAARPDVVVLAGFMRVLKDPSLAAFAGRILNVHPSLLPKFKGRHAVRDALASSDSVTGCTVHLVVPEIDAGRILAQSSVPILPSDTEHSLHSRIQQAEHSLLPQVLASWPALLSQTENPPSPSV